MVNFESVSFVHNPVGVLVNYKTYGDDAGGFGELSLLEVFSGGRFCHHSFRTYYVYYFSRRGKPTRL